MKIGLIDVDNWNHLSNCHPNLPLMKISAWHKKQGDDVSWCEPIVHYDIVYKSKVFSFTKDIDFEINADKIITGGSGYAIKLQNGREIFDCSVHRDLPDEIEHIYPDYSLYGINDTAYGFMSRGCPRGCFFCHVEAKEGRRSQKVADLSEFWSGQKYIELLDPNTLACPEWRDILQQLIDSNSYVNFNQGVDIRLMTEEKCAMLQSMRIRQIHFAWDRYEDKELVFPKLQLFKEQTGWYRSKVTVYVLVNYDTTIDQDLERIMMIRSLNFQPYVMRYDKEHIKRGSELNMLARWCNNKLIFWNQPSFEDYKREYRDGKWR